MTEEALTRETAALGSQSIAAVRAAIERTLKASKALPLPGEGDERAFRGWLVSMFIKPVMRWPENNVRIGEVFDILLLDDGDKETVTIETKPPGHRATPKDRKDFRDRLPRLPRLRAAYFTNGISWDRLDLASTEGEQQILSEVSLDLHTATEEEAESFFSPLRGDRYFPWGQRNRSLVTRDQPAIQVELARGLDSIVAQTADVLLGILEKYEKGQAGNAIQDLTRAIFDDWADRSLEPTVSKVQGAISPLLQLDRIERDELTSILRDNAFTPQLAEATADRLLALTRESRANDERVREALLPSYKPQFAKLCAQTAHTLLARALVYRIGEDMDLFETLISGQAMENAMSSPGNIAPEPYPALALLGTVQRRMLGVLPLLFQLSDLDWWIVPAEKLALLSPAERAVVSTNEKALDSAMTGMLRVLDSFHFSQVDSDVWRNVYENYLPGDERQRLGGFYTPEVLVDFILDEAGYLPASNDLCKRTLLDPSSGSGAFVTSAAARLLRHLQTPLPCHTGVPATRNLPQWQLDKKLLETTLGNIFAIDIHPFAAFLTTINLTFLFLPLYAKVRAGDPSFGLILNVFSADSLEKPDDQSIAPEMFARLNSRIQLSQESAQRYAQLQKTRFDFVVGNPPWGGVLKGPLAPVYAEAKKRRFAREYPNSARGKYDIYGLFIERATQLLTPGGRFAMVTQDTFIDKEWARELRVYLSKSTTLKLIVDLGSFGQLFFKAMNTPAVTIFDNASPTGGSVAAASTTPVKLPKVNAHSRQELVLATVKGALRKLPRTGTNRTLSNDFAVSWRKSLQALANEAPKGWDIRPPRRARAFKAKTVAAAELFELRQGVTPGGCLDIFLLDASDVVQLGLEVGLVYKAVKTREMGRWRSDWSNRILLYPYSLHGTVAEPAFNLASGPLRDSLDFTTLADQRERDIRQEISDSDQANAAILEYRIGQGLIPYPNVARYLTRHYRRLNSRIFKKRRMEFFGREWYEYLWPRDAALLLSAPRILSPRLARQVKFALDSTGFLSDDACLYLIPSSANQRARQALKAHLENVVGENLPDQSILRYCLAFLNSNRAQETLERRRRTPKGSYAISEQFIKEVEIPLLDDKMTVESLLDMVGLLTDPRFVSEAPGIEARLNRMVDAQLA